jgi:hypothetical protein
MFTVRISVTLVEPKYDLAVIAELTINHNNIQGLLYGMRFNEFARALEALENTSSRNSAWRGGQRSSGRSVGHHFRPHRDGGGGACPALHQSFFGAWLLPAPWLLAGAVTAAKWNDVIAGVALILLSFPRGGVGERYGSWDPYVV